MNLSSAQVNTVRPR